jgi:hypothetical protein
LSDLCLPSIIVDHVEGESKGQIVSSETQKFLRKLMSIPLKTIQDECNKTNEYRDLWNTINPNNMMTEYGLEYTTYMEGIRELDPAFLLTCPCTVRRNVWERYPDALFPEIANNHYAAAAVSHPTVLTLDLLNPVLHVFLPTLELKNSTITWIIYSLQSDTH